jgi:Flp pilus assembly protein TadG
MQNNLVPRLLKISGNAGMEVSVPAPRRSPRKGARANSAQGGYILVALSLGLVFLLGMAGLAIDVGRMYIVKSEAQSFTDSASFAAALQLDNTPTGITRAQTAVTNNPKKWQFQNSAFTNVTTSFATASTGPWTTTPPNPPTGYFFTQVRATVSLPMYLMGALAGQHAQIVGSAVAGAQPTFNNQGGEFPFSPYSRLANPDSLTDPFGYLPGNQYTLRWGSPGNQSSCGTDATHATLAENGTVRGYCCAAGNSSLRETIVGGDTVALAVGDPVPMTTGNVNSAPPAIAWRVAMDTDTTSATYAQYRTAETGNGIRVVLVPVNAGPLTNYRSLGFAAFFLLQQTYYEGLNGNDAACGVYIGRYLQGQQIPPAPGGSGIFHIKLFQ